MHERIQELRAACLPFVTRALRGPRKRRFVLASGLMTLLVVLLGAWAALSPGYSAHDLRVSFDLEQSRWDRERTEFTMFVNSEQERDDILAQHARGRTRGYDSVQRRAEEAWVLLDAVAGPHVIPPRGHRELQERARELRNARQDLVPEDLEDQRRYTHFDWYSRHDMERLQAIIDAELEPRLRVYRSPLGLRDMTRLCGLLAGGLLLMLLTVVAPLWVGARMAQELHDNTLQPLTGTALTARQLVLGMILGPLSPIAIVAVPVTVLMLSSAALFGRFVPALGFLALSTAMGAMLVGLAMLLALAVGRRRAPGLVGTGLLALLGGAAMVGLGAGLNLSPDMLGLVTVVPNTGPVHLLTEAFNPVTELRWDHAVALDLRLGLAGIGALTLAVISIRGIERWVAGTHRDGALNRREAIGAAFMLAMLAMAALPGDADFGELFFFGLAMMLVPLQLVLMGRVPGGDVPANLRRIPTIRIIGEYGVWLAIGLVMALLFGGGPERVYAGWPIGVLHLAWALGVVALVTIRTAGMPSSIPVKIWLVVCLGFAMLEYGTAAIWCLDNPGSELLFPLAAANPVLGLIQVGMFLWIPISLIRGLPHAHAASAPQAVDHDTTA